MKQFSNAYIFIFSSVLVLFVAAALSFTSLSLGERQNLNVERERQQNLLASLDVRVSADEVQDVFTQYIKKSMVLNAKGEVVNGSAEQIDLKKETAKAETDRLLPIYEAEKDGKRFVIIPVYGNGLWGPIWGNVALSEDMNTVYGVTFDHKGETPGLGAEIATLTFQTQFKNKTIFNGSSFTSVKVEKPGTYTQDGHTVDAISGGTITSKSLEAMIFNCIKPYQTYLLNNKKQ